MASLDVVSLFPSVPYEFVKNSIKKRWKDIKKHTKLPFNEFMKGLEVLMDSLYFQNDEKYFKQINGLPIGLSVSPIIADLVLQDLEEIFLNRYKKSIKFYGRYVDDSFLIIAKNKLNMLVNLVNSFHNRLQFTYETESNSKINFLDIMVIKNTDGALIFDLYRKPTFSGRYLNFYSAHSIHTKIGIVKSLANKVFNLCDESFHNKNLIRIKEDFC